MAVDSEPKPMLSWKDRLLGGRYEGSKASDAWSRLSEDDDFELLDGNITRSLINDIPTISFSERINQLLIKDMATMVIIKLLGQSIGYNNTEDYEKVLTKGLWTIFGQYLTMQPWTMDFNLMQPYPECCQGLD
ncbi:hypothetical protein Gohar_025648 [Gossypium harknessii]|uniref:DUF4283 domain-containing protein n=1 Tax=Gossypium harknessii TaxID=34285 RepID=A0A7J9ICE3_9ROSI|nr:hypothetical protein [Gossypium harknessii]